jgi:hypothetical protein
LRAIAVRKNGVASLAYGEAIQRRAGRRAEKSNSAGAVGSACIFLARFARSWIAAALRSSQ